MKIKNYTTSVPVARTIGSIEHLLIEIGATGIIKEYKDQKPIGLKFIVSIEGSEQSFLLPTKAKHTKMLFREIPAYKNKKSEWINAQAERTSWRILLNWVEAQCAMIQLGQAEAMQIFLPYLCVKTNVSFYDSIVKHGIDNSKKLLGW